MESERSRHGEVVDAYLSGQKAGRAEARFVTALLASICFLVMGIFSPENTWMMAIPFGALAIDKYMEMRKLDKSSK